MKNKFGKIKYKGIYFSYYVAGHRGGRNLVVCKEYLNDLKEIQKVNKFTVNFSQWGFDAKEEAEKIIKQNFNFLKE